VSCVLIANNNVICANDDDKSHATPVKVQPSDGDAVTSSSRCAAAAPGLLEIKTFNGAQPVYYNQAQCVPLYGQYPGRYKRRSLYAHTLLMF